MRGVSKDVFRIAWWNTGLFPPVRNKAQREAANKAAAIKLPLVNRTIAWMFEQQHFDVIVLGETSLEMATTIQKSTVPRMSVIGDNIIAPLTRVFGICALWDPHTAQLPGFVRNTSRIRMGAETVAAREAQLEIHTLLQKTTLWLRAVHWPSHLRGDATDQRDEVARALFATTQQQRWNVEKNVGDRLIVLGDFNDEPYSAAVEKRLQTTRDRSLLHKESARQLLYNPFWRYVSSRPRICQGELVEGTLGTHYCEKGFSR